MSNVNNLITDNIDVWTSAIKKRNATGRGSSKKIELTGIKKLRKLILELAVRGKLVSQNVKDQPASTLLERITEEREHLVALKKIKKLNQLPVITDEEKPFDIPTSWIFKRFGDLMFNRDGERKPVSASERKGIQGQYDYYGASGVIDQVNDFLFDKSLLLIGEDGANLISRSTPIAFLAHGKYWVNNHAHVLDGITTEFLEFIALHINAISLEAYITGTAQPKMNQAKMNSIVLAVPPEAEQHRIVAKVDELMALCDELEQQTEQSLTAHQTLVETLLATLVDAKPNTPSTQNSGSSSAQNGLTTNAEECTANDFQENWQRIADHFDTLFTTESSIESLKQTILQLAVMGKLVPQNTTDEPASVLLGKIAAEKAQLIADKKIKKQKPLPAITEKDKTLELPNGWEWSRFEGIAKNEKNALKAGPFGSALKKSMYVESGYKIYGQEQVISGNENIGDYFVDEEKYQSLISCKVQPDDMLISLVGTIGKVLVLSDTCHAGIINPRLVKLSLNDSISKRYIQILLGSKLIQDELFEKSHGSTMNVLNLGLLKQLIFPVPCTEEQPRIVAKVDELMALCDQLKARLSDAQTTQVHLADAMVSNALGQKVKNVETKVETQTMKITTALSVTEQYINQDDGLLSSLIKNEDGEADAKVVWNKSKLDLPSFYKQLKKEIETGYINSPAKADFE